MRMPPHMSFPATASQHVLPLDVLSVSPFCAWPQGYFTWSANAWTTRRYEAMTAGASDYYPRDHLYPA
jgi:hypothetical protein